MTDVSKAGGWVVVTPARNEAGRLAGLAASLALQSPGSILLWIVVDDGSTDATEEVARQLDLPFPVRVVEHANSGGLASGSAFAAFRIGAELAWRLHPEAERVAKIDADVRLAPSYVDRVSAAAGSASLTGGRLVNDPERADHVRGALKAYDRAGWEVVSALPDAVGWDVLDEVLLRTRGLQVLVVNDATAWVDRRTGSSEGLIRGRFRAGRVSRWTGYHPAYFGLRLGRYFFRRPVALGAIAMAAGFLSAPPSPHPAAARQAHRAEQVTRLRRLLRHPLTAASGHLSATAPAPEVRFEQGLESVALCVASRGYSQKLEMLLASLVRLEIPDSLRVRLIIVDNGPRPTIDPEAMSRATEGRFETEVAREARAGIPHARNLLVERALAAESQAVAFVDDDETVDPQWLTRLLDTASRFGAAGVAGPVSPSLPADAPAWIVKSSMLERTDPPTGTPLRWAATGSLLMRTEVFTRISPWFDEALAATGGSDAEFTARVVRAGLPLVWCSEAKAAEPQDRGRLTVRWLAVRMLRTGSVAGRHLEARRPWPFQLLHIFGALGRAMAALVLALAKAPRGWEALRQARSVLYFVGLALGRSGVVVGEYRMGSSGAIE